MESRRWTRNFLIVTAAFLVLLSIRNLTIRPSCFLANKREHPTTALSHQRSNTSTATADDGVCHLLAQWPWELAASHQQGTGVFQSALWRQHKGQIRAAARESAQLCHANHRAELNLDEVDHFSERLFAVLDSFRLKRSTKTRANPVVMQKVTEVVRKRLADPSTNPPLKIAVFGGSVTAGHEATKNGWGAPRKKSNTPTFACAWPSALERLLNGILGNGTVVVKNYSISGTDSDVGATLLEYNLWPDGTHSGEEFDIFVSAFSSNDGRSPLAMQEFFYEARQQFVRAAMNQRPCSDLPLVVLLEDNLLDDEAHYRDKLLASHQFSRDMVEIADWSGVMSVSYADAIRSYVYTNTSDTLLTYFGHVHPGQEFHIGIAWTMAWNLLTGVVDSCDAPTVRDYSQPESGYGVPLPMLTSNLKTSEVQSALSTNILEKRKFCEGVERGSTKPTSCAYKWVASKLQTNTKEKVAAAMSRVLTHNTGWQAVGFPVRKPHRTWLGTGLNSTFTIQLNDLEAPIDRMLILYMKSYGKGWVFSRLLLVVEGSKKSRGGKSNTTNEETLEESSWVELHRSELEGKHDAPTSINYSHRINLGDFLVPGSSVRATFTIIGGNRFQVNGLALCSSPRSLRQ